jgi:hypothetical protein
MNINKQHKKSQDVISLNTSRIEVTKKYPFFPSHKLLLIYVPGRKIRYVYDCKRSYTECLRTVFYRKTGQCFTNMFNKNAAYIRSYTEQIRYCIWCQITIIRIKAKYYLFSYRKWLYTPKLRCKIRMAITIVQSY